MTEVDVCVKGNVSINQNINRYAPVYQDAMCQLITDKYYDKITREDNADLKNQYYENYKNFISGIERKDLKINSKFEILKQEVKQFIEKPITSLDGIKNFLERTNINKLPTGLREELLTEFPESINKDVLTVALTPYNKINFQKSSQLLWMNSEANKGKKVITQELNFDKIFEDRNFGMASGGKLEARKFIFLQLIADKFYEEAISGDLKSYDLYTKIAPYQKNEITLSQIQKLTKLANPNIENLKEQADKWFESIIKETINLNTTREIHDKFLENPDIKNLSALERDVLSQMLADKFYEKAEDEVDAYYNLYIAFSPCKNVNENWSTTAEEINKFIQERNSVKVIQPEKRELAPKLITALKENRATANTKEEELSKLPDDLIKELKNFTFFKDNNRNLSAKITFPNNKIIDLNICHDEELTANINAVWNAYRECFGEKQAFGLLLHFCENNLGQGLFLPTNAKSLKNVNNTSQQFSTRIYQDVTVEKDGAINIISTMHGFIKNALASDYSKKTALKTDVDLQLVSHHPFYDSLATEDNEDNEDKVNAENKIEYGSYDIAKTKGQIKMYNENLKPMPKGIQ